PSWCIRVDAWTKGLPVLPAQAPSVIIASPPGRSATPELLVGTWKSGLSSSVPVQTLLTAGCGSLVIVSRHGHVDLGIPRQCAKRTYLNIFRRTWSKRRRQFWFARQVLSAAPDNSLPSLATGASRYA